MMAKKSAAFLQVNAPLTEKTWVRGCGNKNGGRFTCFKSKN